MSNLTAVLALCLGGWIVYDLKTVLRTGKARGRFGTVTRRGRPTLFRNYIIGDCIVLAGCAGVLLWWLVERI